MPESLPAPQNARERCAARTAAGSRGEKKLFAVPEGQHCRIRTDNVLFFARPQAFVFYFSAIFP